MFKCWIYISGEEQISLHTEECLSDKKEVYTASSKETFKETVKENESKLIDSYFPGMRRYGFFDRFVNFS